MLDVVQRIITALTPTQGTKEWLDWRKTRLTASDACALTGNAVKTRQSLLLKKTSPNAVQFKGNEFTESGHINEPIAAELYAKITGRELMTDIRPVEHQQYNWLAASLDAVTACGRNVEIKCLHTTKVLNKPKAVHVKQAQIQMACTGLRVTDLTYYYPNINKRLDIHTVEYDDEWFMSVLPKFQAFATELQAAHACCYDLEQEEWLFDNNDDDEDDNIWQMITDNMEDVDDEMIVLWPVDTTQADWLGM